MIDTSKCEDHLARVRAFADTRGAAVRESLEEKLKYLAEYACHEDVDQTRALLFADSAPHSFQFTMQRRQKDGTHSYWFNGGLIYSGPGQPLDGSAPALTVHIGNPDEGWSVHT